MLEIPFKFNSKTSDKKIEFYSFKFLHLSDYGVE